MPPALGNPQGLWLLGLLAPLVVLYILKVRRQKVTVASTWLWQAAARDLLAKSPWQRLRARLLLLIEALALLALGLALARPALSGGRVDAEHVALVIDTSASMLAKSGPETRFAAAQAAALRVLSSLPPGADALLIAAGSEPHTVGPADRDLARVKARLASLSATGVEGHLERAVALASEQLAQRAGNRRIVVLSDENGLAAALPVTRVPVSVVKVGEPVDNSAIVRVDVGRATPTAGSSTQADRVEVFAEVASFSQSPRDIFVTLKQRSSPTVLASRKLRLEPGQKTPVVLGFEAAEADAGTGLVVELSPPDALPVDDVAYGRVPPSRKLRAITSPAHASPWFERALLADPELELLGVPLAELGTSGIDDDALVVVSKACPAELPGADFVILDPPPGPCRGAIVGKPSDGPVVTSWERTDARLRFITLDGVAIAKASALDPPTAQSLLVKGREGALIVDISEAGRTGTLVGFDVGESNWPLRASFVLFVRNVAELARSHRQSRVLGPARTGVPLRLRVPASATKVSLTEPSGRESELEARGGVALVPSPDQPGFYLLSYQGQRPGVALAVVNLTSEVESDLRPSPAGAEAAGPAPATTRSAVTESPGDLGFIAAALALAAIVAQVWWLTRTPARVDPSRARPLRPERPEAA
ncbi:MAG: VWA domain-containing protein [Myxococcales bacterium]|nr:MAG: VWA domain-containing protein [Myxococcales bacterium]